MADSRIIITKFPFYYSLSGVERHTIDIVKALGIYGCRFYLLSSCPVLLSEFSRHGWKVQRWWLGLPPVNKWTKILFVLTYPFALVSAALALLYFSRRYKTDKLYCLTITEKLIMTPVARLLGYKIFWFEHLTIDPVISQSIYRGMYRAWSHFATVTASSAYVQKQLDKIGVKASVIYHGLNFENYKKQEDIFEAMAERRFVFDRKATFRLGTIGRLEKIKGLEYLIKAVALLKTIIPEIDLIIVGEGSQRENLQWLIDKLDLKKEVKLVGFKDNFLDWILDFDVFVLPSLKESFGIVLLEALACQKPIVATNVGGVPEIIDHGSDGLLVAPADPRAIADAVLWLRNNREAGLAMAARGREKVIKQFDISLMIEKYREQLMS